MYIVWCSILPYSCHHCQGNTKTELCKLFWWLLTDKRWWFVVALFDVDFRCLLCCVSFTLKLCRRIAKKKSIYLSILFVYLVSISPAFCWYFWCLSFSFCSVSLNLFLSCSFFRFRYSLALFTVSSRLLFYSFSPSLLFSQSLDHILQLSLLICLYFLLYHLHLFLLLSVSILF